MLLIYAVPQFPLLLFMKCARIEAITLDILGYYLSLSCIPVYFEFFIIKLIAFVGQALWHTHNYKEKKAGETVNG